MAVFREGYDAVRLIGQQSKQVWNDACDYGAPTKKGDEIWKAVQMLFKYRMGNEEIYRDDWGGYFDVELMDEWAVSDGVKTEEESIDTFRVYYSKFSDRSKRNINMGIPFRHSDGFVTVEKRRK